MLLAHDDDYYIYKIKEIVDDKTVNVITFGKLINGILVERKIKRVMENIRIGIFKEVYIPGAKMK